jgi:hypothetical protein
MLNVKRMLMSATLPIPRCRARSGPFLRCSCRRALATDRRGSGVDPAGQRGQRVQRAPTGVHCHEGEGAGRRVRSRVERTSRECLKPSNRSQIPLPRSPLVATKIGRNANSTRGVEERTTSHGFSCSGRNPAALPWLSASDRPHRQARPPPANDSASGGGEARTARPAGGPLDAGGHGGIASHSKLR